MLQQQHARHHPIQLRHCYRSSTATRKIGIYHYYHMNIATIGIYHLLLFRHCHIRHLSLVQHCYDWHLSPLRHCHRSSTATRRIDIYYHYHDTATIGINHLSLLRHCHDRHLSLLPHEHCHDRHLSLVRHCHIRHLSLLPHLHDRHLSIL